ncbi:sulfurtransferase TusA family protein [Sanguibacter antarcticus]|uniref:tRNA 2-thiouridine synthesizing protein A n=1 Tax=Sanguibacter antarcticus TaxID=372484 RepID=A0A2A9E3G8_9MICO|nr:sulfurtransferase TusA family protein [Sanguibacter antarcticus]PFG32905.1 tRNA 2-thiouridine synthesizing protein A [Sanguibacter antarcticus]
MDENEDALLVDARGLRCPLPVIRLAKTASSLQGGSVLTLWSTDPAAAHDVPAWARMRGHVVESTALQEIDGTDCLVTRVRLGEGP